MPYSCVEAASSPIAASAPRPSPNSKRARALLILGVRERSDKLVRDLVLADPAPFIPLTIAKRGKEIDYEAKAVMLAKTLVGNKGYRRSRRQATGMSSSSIAPGGRDAKLDGILRRRARTPISPLETMLSLQHLWMVERAFLNVEALLANATDFFQKLDETIRGHVASLLASGAEEGAGGPHRHAGPCRVRGRTSSPISNSLTETEVEQDGKRFLLRTPPRPAASSALRAAGVALPPTVRQLADPDRLTQPIDQKRMSGRFSGAVFAVRININALQI